MTRTPMTVADIVDAVANGRIGHSEAIERLGLKTYPELVETMHANGRPLWAHRRPSKIDKETLKILDLACSPPAVSSGDDAERRSQTKTPGVAGEAGPGVSRGSARDQRR